jgi:predicted DNA-binding transcriptional regulator AlpA
MNNLRHLETDPAELFDGEILLPARAIARSLGMSPRAFRRMIEEAGDGPPYFRFGKNLKRYRPSAVKAWAAAHVEITQPGIINR